MDSQDSAKKKRFHMPENEKEEICQKISDSYRYLKGQFTGKYSKEAREKKLEEILEFSRTLEQSKDYFKNEADLWKKFEGWVANLKRKEKDENKTGAAPKKYSKAEQIIANIIHRNDEKFAQKKVSRHFALLSFLPIHLHPFVFLLYTLSLPTSISFFLFRGILCLL